MELLFFLMAYLIGNFTSAYVMGKLIYKQDIRTMGSGNAGATNALRSFGAKFGVMTLLLDLLKGVLAVYIADRFGGEMASYAAALGVVMGHNWPALFGFRGGKGMATSGGTVLYLDPRIFTGLLIVFILVILITRYVSLASVGIAVSAPIIAYLIDYQEKPFLVYTILILAAIIVYKHRSNISRLLKGEESRIRFKGKKNE
ncbi:MAG: glycerol-3-phosphate 1-O-acyltransferase PlsY [Tissierellia bacterium]|nr:glycerol-3-phosphate 1-O-acyltransferase PlsY [Tissierellia bacterium]